VIPLPAHVPGPSFGFLHPTSDVGEITSRPAEGQGRFGRGYASRTVGEAVKEDHECGFRSGVPGPPRLHLIGVGSALQPNDVRLQTTFKGTTAQPRENLITDITPREIHMAGMKKKRIPKLIPFRPHSSDGAADQAQGATRGLELGDIREAFGKKPDELRVKRIACLDLPGVTRFESLTVNLDPTASLLLVIGCVCPGDFCRAGGVHGFEETASEHRGSLKGLGRREIPGMPARRLLKFIDGLKDGGNILFKLTGQAPVRILFGGKGNDDGGSGPAGSNAE